MLDIALDRDADAWPGDDASWIALARDAAEAACAQTPYHPALAGKADMAEISLLLTRDADVRALNLQYRGKDAATNVLSFPMIEPGRIGADNGPALLGDIVLAHGVCAHEAQERGITLHHHAAHLIVHGTLHLLGYDHMKDADADHMEAMETRALARLGIADPYAAQTGDD